MPNLSLREEAVRVAVAAERERCAKIAEDKAEHLADTYAQVCHDIAEAIRLGDAPN